METRLLIQPTVEFEMYSTFSSSTSSASSQNLGVFKNKSDEFESTDRDQLIPSNQEQVTNDRSETGTIRWSGISCYRNKDCWSSFTAWLLDKKRPLILDNVYGEVAKGELVAIVGPSGAGKSTLLTGCLTLGKRYSGWCNNGKISTSYHHRNLNARILHQEELHHLHTNLTVRETLRWAAKIKNNEKGFDPDSKVSEMLATFKLDSNGLPDRQVTNISGGQRKRLAVALELMGKDLDLYLLDEPTSGLDPKRRKEVIKYLEGKAREEKMAIILTIHAPGNDLLEYFSKIIILTNYGQVMYHDSPEKISEAIKYANGDASDSEVSEDTPADNVLNEKSVDGTKAPQKDCKPTELDVLTSVADPETVEEMENCKRLVERTKTTYENKIRQAQNEDENRTKLGLLGYGPKRPLSFCPVFQRAWQTRIIYRLQLIIGITFAFAATSFGTSFMFRSDIGLDAGCIQINESSRSVATTKYDMLEKSDIPNFMKVIQLVFFLLIFAAMVSMLNVALSFPTDFKIFLNEHTNGWYNPVSYFASKILVEVLPQLVMCSIFATIFYWYTSQPDGNNIEVLVGLKGRFSRFLLIVHITAFTAMAIGFLLGAIFVDSINATIVVSTILLLGLSFFSGFFVRIEEMVSWEEGLSDLSFMRWALELSIITIYGNSRCPPPSYAQAVLAFGLKMEKETQKWGIILGNLLSWWFLAVFAMGWKVWSRKMRILFCSWIRGVKCVKLVRPCCSCAFRTRRM